MKNKAFFKAGKGTYGNGNTPVSEDDIFLLDIPTHTSDLTNDGSDGAAPFLTSNYFAQGNSNYIVSGSPLIHLEGYTYKVPEFVYVIRGTEYSSPATIVTLNSPDGTLYRIDSVIGSFDVNGNGVIEVVQGANGAIGVEPTLNEDTQIQLALVTLDPGTTEPSDVNEVIVYDENVEYDVAGAGNLTIDPEDSEDPFNGSVSLKVNEFATGDELKFTDVGGSLLVGSTEYLLFSIKSLYESWPQAGNIRISLLHDDVEIGDSVTLESVIGMNPSPNAIEFSSSSIGVWQKIEIPISYFNSNGSIVNGIKFTKNDLKLPVHFNVDYIRFQGGISNAPVNEPFVIPNLEQVTTQGNKTTNGIAIEGSYLTIKEAGDTLTPDFGSKIHTDIKYETTGSKLAHIFDMTREGGTSSDWAYNTRYTSDHIGDELAGLFGVRNTAKTSSAKSAGQLIGIGNYVDNVVTGDTNHYLQYGLFNWSAVKDNGGKPVVDNLAGIISNTSIENADALVKDLYGASVRAEVTAGRADEVAVMQILGSKDTGTAGTVKYIQIKAGSEGTALEGDDDTYIIHSTLDYPSIFAGSMQAKQFIASAGQVLLNRDTFELKLDSLTLTSNQAIRFPNASGTVLLDTDAVNYKIEFVSSDFTVPDSSTFAAKEVLVIKNVSTETVRVFTQTLDKLEGQDDAALNAGDSITLAKYQVNDFRVI